MRSSFLSCLMCLIAGSALAARADEHADLVWRQLQNVEPLWVERGFAPTSTVLGYLSQGDVDPWSFELEAGVSYGLVAACDGDCSALGLAVVGADGEHHPADALRSDLPMLVFTAQESGEYTIEISMEACSAAPCAFGFTLYVGDAPWIEARLVPGGQRVPVGARSAPDPGSPAGIGGSS